MVKGGKVSFKGGGGKTSKIGAETFTFRMLFHVDSYSKYKVYLKTAYETFAETRL